MKLHQPIVLKLIFILLGSIYLPPPSPVYADEFCNVDAKRNYKAQLHDTKDFKNKHIKLGEQFDFRCPHRRYISNLSFFCLRDGIWGCDRTWNNQASSIRIKEGYIQVWLDKNKRGDTRIFGPGGFNPNAPLNESQWKSFKIPSGFGVTSVAWTAENPGLVRSASFNENCLDKVALNNPQLIGRSIMLENSNLEIAALSGYSQDDEIEEIESNNTENIKDNKNEINETEEVETEEINTGEVKQVLCIRNKTSQETYFVDIEDIFEVPLIP